MPDICDHALGLLNGKDVTKIDCEAVRNFMNEVRQFNTSRKVLPHPGLFILANFCHKCGSKLDKELNKDELNKFVIEQGEQIYDASC